MTKLSRQNLVNMTHKYYADGGIAGYNGDSCVYFGDDGGRCAIGVVLDHLGFSREDLNGCNDDTDARELTEFLGERFTDHLDSDAFTMDGGDNTRNIFLLRLQSAHDSAMAYGGNSNDVAESIAHFAQKEGLTAPE